MPLAVEAKRDEVLDARAGGQGAGQIPAGHIALAHFEGAEGRDAGREVSLVVRALAVPCRFVLNGNPLIAALPDGIGTDSPRACRLVVNPAWLRPQDPQLLVVITEAPLAASIAPWRGLWLTTPVGAATPANP